jgi:hypothetical protein
MRDSGKFFLPARSRTGLPGNPVPERLGRRPENLEQSADLRGPAVHFHRLEFGPIGLLLCGAPRRFPACCEDFMSQETFHRAIGLPRGAAETWAGNFRLVYSQHALKACRDDRYGEIPVFPSAEFEAQDVVEVTTEYGAGRSVDRAYPVKAVIRAPWTNELDLIFVVEAPVNGVCVVRTCWYNLATDKHATLNKTAYKRLKN